MGEQREFIHSNIHTVAPTSCHLLTEALGSEIKGLQGFKCRWKRHYETRYYVDYSKYICAVEAQLIPSGVRNGLIEEMILVLVLKEG